MHVVAFIGQKGGSTRSTSAISLAVAAERNSKPALVIDLDPQATACKWSDRRKADAPIVIDCQPARLQRAIERAREGGIEWISVDTPPRSAEASLAAAKVADLIIMPMRPQINDLETVPNTLDLITTAARSRNGAIPTIALLGAVPPQGKRHEQAKSALEGMGVRVCPHTIGHRASFGDAAALGLTVLEHDHGKAAEEVRMVYRYMLAGTEGKNPK